MKLKTTEKKEFVKIIIGNSETGFSGLQAPTKSISLEDTDVEEVYEKIMEMITNDKNRS